MWCHRNSMINYVVLVILIFCVSLWVFCILYVQAPFPCFILGGRGHFWSFLRIFLWETLQRIVARIILPVFRLWFFLWLYIMRKSSTYLKYPIIRSKSKSHYDRQSVGQFVLVSCPSWSTWPDVTFIWVTITFFIFHVGRPLWREDGSVICSAMTQAQFQVTLRPTVCQPVRLGAGRF
jgi:hypothetical protein